MEEQRSATERIGDLLLGAAEETAGRVGHAGAGLARREGGDGATAGVPSATVVMRAAM